MSPEERDELIDFILQSQANAADRHLQLADNVEKLADTTGKLADKVDMLADKVNTLAGTVQGLVEVARIHSRRLDRLEGLSS